MITIAQARDVLCAKAVQNRVRQDREVLQGLAGTVAMAEFWQTNSDQRSDSNGTSRSFCFEMKKHHFRREKNPPSTFVSFVAFDSVTLVAFIQFILLQTQQTWPTTQPHRKPATVSPVLLTPSSTTSTGDFPLPENCETTRLTDSAATTTMESTRRCSRTMCALAATATRSTKTVTSSRTRSSSMLAAEPVSSPCAHPHSPTF
jgi:cytoskeletal protein RodZ